MKLLVVSIAPIYKDHVQGGSQKILVDVLRHVSRSHEVRLFCTSREDNCRKFTLAKNLTVHPFLRFRPHFPFPYMTNPRHLKEIISLLCREALWADCVYIHADGFFFKHFLRLLGKPLITSLHDYVYPISITSSFLAEMDKVIVPSQYVKDCIAHSVGGLFHGYMDRVVVVENGVDSGLMSRDSGNRDVIRKKLGLKKTDFAMLFPHRPEDVKGVFEAIELLASLRRSALPAKLLFLKHFDVKTNSDLRGIYAGIEAAVAKKGLKDSVIFHDWILSGNMRGIYSASDVTLNLGQFIESFGLVPIESALCETPVIAASVGCLRDNLAGLPGIFLTDYGDIRAAHGACENIYSSPPEMRATREHMRKQFSFKDMLAGYCDEFEKTRVEKPLSIDMESVVACLKDEKFYRLAPWCCVSKAGIYDDYAGQVRPVPGRRLSLFSKAVFPKSGEKWFRNLIDMQCVVPAGGPEPA